MIPFNYDDGRKRVSRNKHPEPLIAETGMLEKCSITLDWNLTTGAATVLTVNGLEADDLLAKHGDDWDRWPQELGVYSFPESGRYTWTGEIYQGELAQEGVWVKDE